MVLENATEDAVDWAIRKNLLDGLFKKEKSQIMGNILCEFNQDVYERDIFQDGKDEGIAEGSRTKALEAARTMLADKVEPTLISRYTGLDLHEIMQLK